MPETLWHCRVKEFGPLIVSIDTEGRNLFEENKVIFNQRKDKAIEEICKHVGFTKIFAQNNARRKATQQEFLPKSCSVAFL